MADIPLTAKRGASRSEAKSRPAAGYESETRSGRVPASAKALKGPREPAEKADGIVVIDLDQPWSTSSRDGFEQLIAVLGWDSNIYLNANPDIGIIDQQGGHTKLLAHFLRNGIAERRHFSETVALAKAFVFEQSIRYEDYLIVVGWSETPIEEPKVVVRCEDGSFAILPAAHITFWRDDVAKHLGIAARRKSNGFIVILNIPENLGDSDVRLLLRDREQMLLGSVSPRKVELDEFMRNAFMLLQDRLSYEEMVSAFSEEISFLEFLRKPMKSAFAEAPAEIRYGEAHARETADLTVCVVMLGKSVLLKPFMASLFRHRPRGAVWQVLLLANGGLDLENIRSAAEWCAEVYGAEVTVFASRYNLGFGGGMNFLASRASGRVTMLSNVDLRFTELDVGSVTKEVTHGNAILAAYQFNSGGSLQHAGLVHDRRAALVNGKLIELLDTRLIGRNTYPGRLERKEVEYFGAACLLGDTATLRRLGPFSSKYFYAYHEDCDLARRARSSGIACVLSPAFRVVHYESSGAAGPVMPLRALNAANLVFFMREGGAARDRLAP